MLRDEGFELTLASRTAEKIEAAGAELGATAIAADVSKPEDCERVVREHVDRTAASTSSSTRPGSGSPGESRTRS